MADERFFTPELEQKEFDVASGRLGREQEQGRDRLRKGFRRSRLRSTGALLDQMRQFDERASTESADLITNLQLAQAGRKREERMIGEGRQFQTSERLGGQQFAIGERLGGQQFATGERAGRQEFAGGESALARALQESLLGKQLGFQGEQAGLNRTFQGSQAELNRKLQDIMSKRMRDAGLEQARIGSEGSGLFGEALGGLFQGIGSAGGLGSFFGSLFGTPKKPKT